MAVAFVAQSSSLLTVTAGTSGTLTAPGSGKLQLAVVWAATASLPFSFSVGSWTQVGTSGNDGGSNTMVVYLNTGTRMTSCTIATSALGTFEAVVYEFSGATNAIESYVGINSVTNVSPYTSGVTAGYTPARASDYVFSPLYCNGSTINTATGPTGSTQLGSIYADGINYVGLTAFGNAAPGTVSRTDTASAVVYSGGYKVVGLCSIVLVAGTFVNTTSNAAISALAAKTVAQALRYSKVTTALSAYIVGQAAPWSYATSALAAAFKANGALLTAVTSALSAVGSAFKTGGHATAGYATTALSAIAKPIGHLRGTPAKVTTALGAVTRIALPTVSHATTAVVAKVQGWGVAARSAVTALAGRVGARAGVVGKAPTLLSAFVGFILNRISLVTIGITGRRHFWGVPTGTATSAQAGTVRAQGQASLTTTTGVTGRRSVTGRPQGVASTPLGAFVRTVYSFFSSATTALSSRLAARGVAAAKASSPQSATASARGGSGSKTTTPQSAPALLLRGASATRGTSPLISRLALVAKPLVKGATGLLALLLRINWMANTRATTALGSPVKFVVTLLAKTTSAQTPTNKEVALPRTTSTTPLAGKQSLRTSLLGAMLTPLFAPVRLLFTVHGAASSVQAALVRLRSSALAGSTSVFGTRFGAVGAASSLASTALASRLVARLSLVARTTTGLVAVVTGFGHLRGAAAKVTTVLRNAFVAQASLLGGSPVTAVAPKSGLYPRFFVATQAAVVLAAKWVATVLRSVTSLGALAVLFSQQLFYNVTINGTANTGAFASTLIGNQIPVTFAQQLFFDVTY